MSSAHAVDLNKRPRCPVATPNAMQIRWIVVLDSGATTGFLQRGEHLQDTQLARIHRLSW